MVSVRLMHRGLRQPPLRVPLSTADEDTLAGAWAASHCLQVAPVDLCDTAINKGETESFIINTGPSDDAQEAMLSLQCTFQARAWSADLQRSCQKKQTRQELP